MMSLDGYIEDKSGKFDWAAPDDEVHAFVNDLVRSTGTFLYGRRMYATMVARENAADDPGVSDGKLGPHSSVTGRLKGFPCGPWDRAAPCSRAPATTTYSPREAPRSPRRRR
jgi:hypothetical protein